MRWRVWHMATMLPLLCCAITDWVNRQSINHRRCRLGQVIFLCLRLFFFTPIQKKGPSQARQQLVRSRPLMDPAEVPRAMLRDERRPLVPTLPSQCPQQTCPPLSFMLTCALQFDMTSSRFQSISADRSCRVRSMGWAALSID